MDKLEGSLLLEKYRVMSKKGEGTFSEVIKAQRIRDGVFCAVKRMKTQMHSQQQVNNLREVQALKRLNPHPNIIRLMEVLFDPKRKTLDIICELMDMNIYEKIRGRKHHLPESLVKSYVYQLCKALDHMHRNGIFHRDVKPENILIKDTVLKLADFGSCRGVYSKPPFTEYISTRWYRAPECLLTDGYYNSKMDMWSVGCVFFEILSLYPLFPGSNETDQLAKIHDIMGTPSPQVLSKIRKNSPHYNFTFPPSSGSGLAKRLPHASAECLELLNGLLIYDPDLRYSARQALKHPYFRELRDADKRKARLASKAAAVAAGPANGAAHSTSTGTGTGIPRRSRRIRKPKEHTEHHRGHPTHHPHHPHHQQGGHSYQAAHHRRVRRRAPAVAAGGPHGGQKAAAAAARRVAPTKLVEGNPGLVQLKSVQLQGHHVDRRGKPKRRHKKKQVTIPASKQIVEVPALPPIMYKAAKPAAPQTHAESSSYNLPGIASNAAGPQ